MMSMPPVDGAPDDGTPTGDLTLTDYVQRAASTNAVEQSDGTTVVYLQLRRLERYSTLPRPKWQGWFSRALRATPTAPAPDSLGDAANVRRVPRRIL